MKKYTVHNRAELLADIAVSIKKHEESKVKLKEAERAAAISNNAAYEAHQEMEYAYKEGVRLQLQKDEFGIYLCQDNYTDMRAKAIAKRNAEFVKAMGTTTVGSYFSPDISYAYSILNIIVTFPIKDCQCWTCKAFNGLAGMYAIGAGTAAVFADENDHVEKELNKLVVHMREHNHANLLQEVRERITVAVRAGQKSLVYTLLGKYIKTGKFCVSSLTPDQLPAFYDDLKLIF